MKKKIRFSLFNTTLATLVLFPSIAAAEGALGARGEAAEEVEIEAPVLRSTRVPRAKTKAEKRSIALPTSELPPLETPSLDEKIARYSPGLSVCRGLVDKLEDRAAGRFDVEFEVGRRGRPKNVRVTRRGRTTPLERCVALKISDWVLQPGSEGVLEYHLGLDSRGRIALKPSTPKS